MTLKQIPQRQLDLGPAGWFRPEAEEPAANQVRVKAGRLYAGAFGVYDKADQLTAGFAVVGGGFQRFDLVYLDSDGDVQILQGTAVASGSADFEGAPGWTGATPGPNLPDTCIPIAWVKITETVTVIVDTEDITPLQGIYHVGHHHVGHYVDKGLLGAAPTGANDVVTALFAGEDSGGDASTRGIVTTAPLNFVFLVDGNGDELVHAATGARIYGRLTEAAGVWTLTYYYTDATGVETAVADIAAETDGGAPADLRLAGVPKVYSFDDPNRPLFDSSVVRVADQVVGDIPVATTTQAGKVMLATDGETTAGEAVQGNDARLTGPQVRRNSGGSTLRRHRLNLIESTNITIAIADDAVNDEVDITISAAGLGTYRVRSNGAVISGTGDLSLAPSDGIAYTPRLAIVIGSFPGPFTNVGFAVGTGAGQQANFMDTGATSSTDTGVILRGNSGPDELEVDTFTSVNVNLNRNSGSADFDGVLGIIGDA
jgi:hypothetical protein